MAFLSTKDLLDLDNLKKEEIEEIIDLAIKLKAEGKNHLRADLAGKSVGLVFNKPSTRTRVSFEVGTYQLGGSSLYLQATDLQMKRGETIGDTAKVLSSYLDAIVLRTHSHSDAEELAKHASISVINALTDLFHPCQALADLMTVYERKKSFEGLKIAYFGDGNNVCHSLIMAAAKIGLNLDIATPAAFEPDKEVLDKAKSILSSGSINVSDDPEKAAADADVLYTDVWISMGDEDEEKERVKVFKPYQLNESLLKMANSEAIVMHCLPAHRGQEITSGAMDSKNSAIFQQAENRLYSQKALLIGLIGN